MTESRLPRNGGLTLQQARSFLTMAFLAGGISGISMDPKAGRGFSGQERRSKNQHDYYRFMVGLMRGKIDPEELADGKGADWLAEAKQKFPDAWEET